MEIRRTEGICIRDCLILDSNIDQLETVQIDTQTRADTPSFFFFFFSTY